MKKLNVSIEINGEQIHVGNIEGSGSNYACFKYSKNYIEAGFPQISVSLPIREEAYDAKATKNFFEGLLPEGFARKSVAGWIHVSEDDYLTILQVLGAECLGALRISDDNTMNSGYDFLPLEQVRKLAEEGVAKSTELITEAHLSLTGASGKAGLYYDIKSNRWFKPKGDAPSTHIVKQSHIRLSNIVANEQLSLMTAAKLGIDVPKSFIVNTGSPDEEGILFATERYDRQFSTESKTIDGLPCPFRLHQEDFAQAMGIPAMRKYETSGQAYMNDIFRIIRNNFANPIRDQLKLWDILVYDYLVGNTDNHIKNISLLYSTDLRSIELAPAYDIVSTCVYEGSSRNMAIGIDGITNIDQIRRSNFASAAENAGISGHIAIKRFDKMADEFENALNDASEELCEQGFVSSDAIRNKILLHGGYGKL